MNSSKPHKQLLTDSLFSEVLQKANASPRKRANHNFHELSEVYQRFLKRSHSRYIHLGT
ncbi:hypothetical protein LEP1GSC016_1285 [Leptospira borgpetersenii serovar Hardjo-bovis str. Sponselee]|uniref:Cupin fold metalloprotein WbuC cupin domain-containing protein n=1 Tax=Leptospira borgpetersenii serovar Hardjo-bovis str. Sponselee TaxID=1303729 RepID=M6BRL3_LEPBO|nr:hypothetical protein LEP1GSC016_1285 [Leptospira borgpetersenii serovar Hardjo-bovis str. Sponselee]